MAKTQTVLQIFLASPSDIIDERKIVEDVIDEINVTWSDSHEVRLELLKWETHTRPSFGEDAQDVINQQIGDEYDIFLGIMWGRFGSQTNRAESGTEEEFERAYARLSKSPESVQIMFYFKDAGIPPSKSDPAQLSKVKAFKDRISTELGGLYHEFETPDQFETKVRIHLSKLVQDWLKSPATTAPAKTTSTPSPAEEAFDPLANLAALTDEDEDGLFELADRVNEAMTAVNRVVTEMTEATSELGEKSQQRTKEFTKLTAGGVVPNAKAAKRVSNDAAHDLEVYVQRISAEIPEFHKQHSAAMDTFGKIAMISATDLVKAPDDIRNTLKNIQEYRSSVSNSFASTNGLRDTTAALPRMTTAFNRARRRAVAVMDDLLVQFRNAESQAGDVEELLNRMLVPSNED